MRNGSALKNPRLKQSELDQLPDGDEFMVKITGVGDEAITKSRLSRKGLSEMLKDVFY